MSLPAKFKILLDYVGKTVFVNLAGNLSVTCRPLCRENIRVDPLELFFLERTGFGT